MRSFLLLAVLSATTATTAAQQADGDTKKPLEQLRVPEGRHPQITELVIGGNQPGLPRANKPGLYALPQDNMPCIVPDTKAIADMPNGFVRNPRPRYGQMPNALPPKNSPDKVRPSLPPGH